MENISRYILGLIVMSILSSAIMIFAPDNGIKKYLKYPVAMIIALTLLMPLRDILFDLPSALSEMTNRTQISDRYLDVDMPDSSELIVNYTANRLRAELEYMISDRFGVNADIMPHFDTSDLSSIELEKVTVMLREGDEIYADDIKLYLSAKLGCDAETVSGGE